MNILSYLTKLSKLNEEYHAEVSKVSVAFANDLGACFKSLCEKIPSIKKMGWSQYTPTFNDGEPCKFSANGITIAFSDAVDDDDLAYEDYDISEDGNILKLDMMPSEENLINNDGKYSTKRNQAIIKHLSLDHRTAIREFFDMWGMITEDLLERTFDEGLIIYSADGSYEHNDYDHD